MRVLTTCGLLAVLAMPVLPVSAQEEFRAPTDAGPADCGPCLDNLGIGFRPAAPRTGIDTIERRRAVEYSDAYATRLAIHRVASYAEIPLFVAEYFLGEKLLSDRRNGTFRGGEDDGGGAHGAVAAGLGALFAVNTVTGAWNLYDSRHDPAGRTRRWVHTLTMLAADVGFLLTAQAAEDASRSDAGATTHRQRAIVSMSLATASTLLMWIWKD